MLLLVIRVLYAFVCAGAISTYVYNVETRSPLLTFCGMLILTQAVTFADILIKRKRIEIISSVYFGLLIGVLLSYLMLLALEPIIRDYQFRGLVVIGTTLILPYICISLLLQTKDDFRFVIPYVEFSRELKGGRVLIVDSSSLIDGRIADIIETNIIDTELIVPDFVLQEIQGIADNHDKHRRTRGRRGLEVLAKLQEDSHATVRMYDAGDNAEGQSVDNRIVALAQELNAGVITSDFNLNKVASVQGVTVINLNDVANALKPRYIPGERFQIMVMKEGEAYGQGVGYLDDGTMVVCENAHNLIGKTIDVIVTSVLQNSAGRMIFAKPVFTPKSEQVST
ncbi:MAG: PIN domain-containing protein [Planctomycetota bacterium]|nr:PIN domain-containing protein [Planctomycetota bacterium]